MSELFDDEGDEAPLARPPRPARRRALLLTVLILAALLLGFMMFSALWTQKLWFDSVGYTRVFGTLVGARILLFVVFGLLMAVTVGANMLIAYRLRPIFRPTSPEQVGLDRYREAVNPIRKWLLLGFSLLVGVFTGASAGGQWRSFLLWRNSVSIGQSDPFLHRDIGFYLFQLPWLHFLVDVVTAVAVVSLLAATVVHYLFGGIQLAARRDRFTPAAQAHLSVLAGIFLLAKAVGYWLSRFDLLTHQGARFTGMNFTGEHADLPAKNILTGIALICALLFFLNTWRRTWRLPLVGLGLMGLSSVLLGMIWPAVVQRFQVEPTEADKEAPYIERNIEATRDSYGIADTKVTDYNGVSSLNNEQLAAKAVDNPGVRLVDPRLVQQLFEQKQQVRGYYSTAPILDVDRYQILGRERDLVLGVRELNQNGLPDNSKNWSNLHTVYTHGYGVIAAYGNQRPADNGKQATGTDPAWAEKDIPPRGEITDESGGYEGRIYFGEQSPDYSVVGKASSSSADVELDLPGGAESDDEQTTTTYDGQAGVPISNLLNKLMFAVRFGDANLVLSQRVHDNSKILFNRDPRSMVENVAPWLTVDEDPFPAVVDHRIVWVMDGYTTSDGYPNGELESFESMTNDALAQNSGFQTLPTDEINYMRNAVKATVDAYDGTVTLYAWDESDPLLQAWRSAFPGTVKDRSEIPDELLPHLRYPEDLFKVQRYQLASYHVTDAADFYERNDQWSVPADPDQHDSLQPPYRLTVSPLGGEEAPAYSLTSVFVPTNRSNLAAFLSADSEANTDGYGTLQILRLGSNEQIAGPGQIANQIGADEDVKEALLSYRQGDSKVLPGNLLTLPINGGLLYVQPIYVQRSGGEGNYPVLQFVAVSLGKEAVGIGTTFDRAIFDLLGLSGSTETGNGTGNGNGNGNGNGGKGDGSVASQVRNLLSRADREFQLADDALRTGDLQGYADHAQKAQEYVSRALRLADEKAADRRGG
ncbi:MAG: UPF0182 family protein [Nocardioides sp.]|uniref:UPF0182 family membrane protein n=1 Tax=Nocardioides sp. TaxID=35761 RepID=UPI0039E6A876